MSNITIIGTGYVGTVSGACFAKLGHVVTLVDIDPKKVEQINSKKSPIYEPGLVELLQQHVGKNLSATTHLEQAISASETVFICVGTPSKASGQTDLKYIKKIASQLGRIFKAGQAYKLVIVKSTVPPGTTELVGKLIEKSGKARLGIDFGLVMSPEFLREGSAIYDSLNPDRIVVGFEREKDREMITRIFASFNCPKLFFPLKTAEMIKYSSNSFLATKISFINEIGNICKKLDIDVYDVADGMGMDSRIGRAFLNAGCGFGGSCFPKDVSSLIYVAKINGVKPRILKSTMEINKSQPLIMVSLLERKMGDLKGKTVGVLGLAFKPNTDDIRESSAIPIIKNLLEKGANVVAYDPTVKESMQHLFPAMAFGSSAAEVEKKSDCLLLITNWKEFENLRTAKPVVDGKRVFGASAWSKDYEGICW